MHYHGADGVHMATPRQKIVFVLGSQSYILDLTQAIYKCMKSISPLITSSFGSGSAEVIYQPLKRSFMNVDDPKLEIALKNALILMSLN